MMLLSGSRIVCICVFDLGNVSYVYSLNCESVESFLMENGALLCLAEMYGFWPLSHSPATALVGG